MSGYGGGYEYNAGGGADANNGGGFFAYNNGAQMGNNAGGGFITSPNGGGGDMASPGTARQTREKQSMMPLTIKQVLGAQHATSDDKPKVDGVELHQVRLMGAIVEVTEHSTNTIFRIEDGTGRIDVKVFNDNDETVAQRERRERCQEGIYVKVVGNLRHWQDKAHIVAFDVRPLIDHNELTQHYLEAIYAHLQNTRGKLPGAAGASSSSSGGNMAYGSPAGRQGQMPGGNFGGGGMMQQGNGNMQQQQQGNANANSDFTPLQQAVLDVFNNDDKPEGLSVQFVARHVNGATEEQVREVAQMLADEGHLYTTTDESHYKSTA